MPRRLLHSSLTTLVTAASLFIAPSVASAQAESAGLVTAPVADSSPASPLFGGHKGLGLGVKGGALFSSLTGSTTYKNRTGLIAGLFIGGNGHGLAGVMLEVLYAQKGAGTAGSPITAHYIEVPVLLRLNIGGIYTVLGPYVDIKLKASGFNVSQNFDGFDFGVLTGAGVEFKPFLLEVRETFGLRSVLDATTHSRAFAVLAGFRFN